MGDGFLEKFKSTIEHGRYMDISILQDVYKHIKRYDDPNQRKEYNYVSKISKKNNISKGSVIKAVDIFEEMGLVERVSNGRKNTIKLKVVEKS